MWHNTLNVAFNAGNGSFGTPVTYVTSDSPWSLAAGDFNGDGVVDSAVANASWGILAVWVNNAEGTFTSQVTYAGAQVYEALGNGLVAGDFIGDGHLDLAAANRDTINVWPSQCE